MLYEMGRAFDEHPDDGLPPGSSVRGALRGFFHNGVCREDPDRDDPLQVGLNEWEFTIDRAKDARHVTLGFYARLQYVLLDYHCALNEIGVVVVSTKLHDGWRLGATLDSEKTEEKWHIRWDGSQQTRGGHAVVIIGYDEGGFLIRNSWGERWSCWRDAYAGVAHWSYDDWQHNVMDGWVIRLGVAGGHDSRAVGVVSPSRARLPHRRAAPRREFFVNGHYLHVKDGRLVTGGPHNCSKRSIAETAMMLRTTKDYDHLMVAVESGLEAFDTMVERAVVLIPHLKAARIYPLFVWWHEGCFELASELLEDRARRLEPRTGGVQQLGAFLLETFAREFMQPFWRTLTERHTLTMWAAKKTCVFQSIDAAAGIGQVARTWYRSSVDCPLCRSALSSITRSDTSAASERAGMATLKAYQPVKRLSKKGRRGFRGYPVATIAFYGPDAGRASKVTVGIVMTEGEEVADLRRWTSVDRDVRRDPAIAASILEFIAQFEVRTVVMTDRIIGCPHEEGIDYEGSVCPRCEFWANRDRWIGEVIH